MALGVDPTTGEPFRASRRPRRGSPWRTFREALGWTPDAGSGVHAQPMPQVAFDPERMRVTPAISPDRESVQPDFVPSTPVSGTGPALERFGSQFQPPPMMPDFPNPEDFGIGAGPAEHELGGGFGFDASTGMAAISQAQSDAAAAAAALDGMFEERMQILREMYQFEESPEEKARIQHLHDIIQVQRDQGTEVIERVYGQAIEDAAKRTASVREMGTEAGQRTRETFQDAASETADMLAGLGAEFGGAMGAGSQPLSPLAEGAVADMQRQAETEAAFDERMFNVSADDIQFLGEAMGPEMGAQVGALHRTAADASAIGQMQHDQMVSQRTGAERMAYAQAIQQLAGMFDQRRFGLEDLQTQLAVQQAQMQQQASQFGASLAAQQAQAGPTWQQQFGLDQAMQQWQIEMDEFMRQQEQHQHSASLRGLTPLSPQQSSLAAQLGLAPSLVDALLRSQLMPEMMAGLGQ